MKKLYLILSLVVLNSFCFGESLNKARELVVEEEVESGAGVFKEKKSFKIGNVYINKTKRNAKFFIGEKVAGSISSGGKMSLESPKGVKSSVKLELGTARFKVKELKNEAFVVRTPAATAGVRGTAFSIYIDGENERITLPEGALEVIRNDKTVELDAGQKVTILQGELKDAEQMSDEEMTRELGFIRAEVRHRNPKIEKALESYEKKIKDYKGKIEEGKKKEGEKVKKVIDSEIKKAERGGDIRMLDHLKHLRDNLHLNTSNQNVGKSLKSYRDYSTKLESKYQPYLDREHLKMEKLFKDEISKSIKSKDLDTARDLDTWHNKSMMNAFLFSRYMSQKSPGNIEFRPDGQVMLRGQICTYKQEGNFLIVEISRGQYQGWVDIFLTKDQGATYHNVMLDRDNKHGRHKVIAYEDSDYILISMIAKLQAKRYKQTQGGDIWTFSVDKGIVQRKRDTMLFQLDKNHLRLMDKEGPKGIWETRDGGRTFRLIQNQEGRYPFERSPFEITAQK